MWQYRRKGMSLKRNKKLKFKSLCTVQRYGLKAEHEMYYYTGNIRSHQNSNKMFKEKFGSHSSKTSDRFATKDSCTQNDTRKTGGTAVWKLQCVVRTKSNEKTRGVSLAKFTANRKVLLCLLYQVIYPTHPTPQRAFSEKSRRHWARQATWRIIVSQCYVCLVVVAVAWNFQILVWIFKGRSTGHCYPSINKIIFRFLAIVTFPLIK